jgi:hypothetical protein
METVAEIIEGFHDVGITFRVDGENLKILIPENVAPLSDIEKRILRELKLDIIMAINN